MRGGLFKFEENGDESAVPLLERFAEPDPDLHEASVIVAYRDPVEITIEFLNYLDILKLCHAITLQPQIRLRELPVDAVWMQLQLLAKNALGLARDVADLDLCNKETFDSLYIDITQSENHRSLMRELHRLMPLEKEKARLFRRRFFQISAVIFLLVTLAYVSINEELGIHQGSFASFIIICLSNLLVLPCISALWGYFSLPSKQYKESQTAYEALAVQENSRERVLQASPVLSKIAGDNYLEQKSFYMQLVEALQCEREQRHAAADVQIDIESEVGLLRNGAAYT